MMMQHILSTSSSKSGTHLALPGFVEAVLQRLGSFLSALWGPREQLVCLVAELVHYISHLLCHSLHRHDPSSSGIEKA